jgi:hypothetical protein
MGSDCFFDPVVMIPLDRLLRRFLTYFSLASFLDTETLQAIITGQLSSLLSLIITFFCVVTTVSVLVLTGLVVLVNYSTLVMPRALFLDLE